ncbi:unnamed protein product, partial [Vitis vinifera]
MVVVEAFLSSLFKVVLDKLVATPLLDYARRIKVDPAVLQEWRNTLLHLQAMLHDAEQRQIREEAVKRWVDDLKALAYDIEDVLDEKSDLHLTESVGGESSVTEQRLTTSLIDKAEFYGRDGDKEKIMELLLSDEIATADKVQVIPIVGMGGVGKTTIAQMIYNDERVGDNFDIRVWVFFLVLDDIWNEDPNSWSTLQAPFRNGAQGNCWSLFARIAFENITPDARQNLEPIGRKIIKKCDGLPLAANTLAGLLRFTITSLQNLKGGEMMEDVGEICFQNLLSRSFFQQSGHNKSMFVMHDLIHDLAQFKFDPLHDIDKLRTFLPLSKPACYKVTYLPDSFGNLKHLRYLNLSNTEIRKLPKSIGMLLNLQSLILSKYLRMLTTFVVGKHGGARLGELRDLAHLQGALSILNLQNVENATEVNLMKKEDLDDLDLCIVKMADVRKVEMLEWEEWVCREIEFPCLKELYIKKCPKLKKDLPKHLPKLTKLEISECEQLVCCLPMAPSIRELMLVECDDVMEIPPILHSLTSLKNLNIQQCESLASFPEMALPPMLEWLRIDSSLQEDMPHNHYASLTNLTIWNGLHHVDLTSLQKLSINNCPNLVSFPRGGLPTPNLRMLRIRDCEKLKSLPQGMHTLLTSLQYLWIDDCPEIDSFPEGGLPTNLSFLDIENCNKLLACRMEWGLQTLPFLRTLGIQGYEKERFPEERFLPSTLTALLIRGFPNLKSLDNKGLQHLTSLETLLIRKCGNLKSFPKQGLPSSLSGLYIKECPLLKKRFPEERFLPSTLTSLQIRGFPNLKFLDNKGLQHLTSLETLEIWKCGNLKSFPKQGLPPSLSHLDIDECLRSKLLLFSAFISPGTIILLMEEGCPPELSVYLIHYLVFASTSKCREQMEKSTW